MQTRMGLQFSKLQRSCINQIERLDVAVIPVAPKELTNLKHL